MGDLGSENCHYKRENNIFLRGGKICMGVAENVRRGVEKIKYFYWNSPYRHDRLFTATNMPYA